MSVSRDDLAAFADGELEPTRRAEIAAAVAGDPALAAQVETHRALKGRLAGHFAPVLDAPLPVRLTAPLIRDAEIVDFAAARAARVSRRTLPRWSWIAGPALAASLALALFAPRGGSPEYADGLLAGALDNQLVASQPGDAPTRILLSFRDGAGEYCRAFTGERAGIACRDDRGWKLRNSGAGSAAATGKFRQAGNAEAALLAAAQELAAGPALDAAGERAARKSGWRTRR